MRLGKCLRVFCDLAAGLAALLAMPCASAQDLSPSNIPARPQVTMVADAGVPPHSFTDLDGEPAGIYVDFWREWARAAGVELNIVLKPWSQALDAIRSGEADVIVGIFHTEERTEWLDFTPPYYAIDMGIFFRQTIHGLTGPADLEGFAVGVVREDWSALHLRKLLGDRVTLVEYPTPAAMVQAAVAGEINVFVTSSAVGQFYLARAGVPQEFRQTTKPVAVREVHAAVRKGDAVTLGLLLDGLDRLPPNALDTIRAQWMGNAFSSGIPWRVVAAVVLLLLLIAAVSLFWHQQLRVRVRHATADLVAQREALVQSGQALRHSEERLRTVLHALPEAALVVDDQGLVREAYSSAELLNDASDSVIGQSVHALFATDCAEALLAIAHKTLHTAITHVAPCVLEHEGRTRQIEAHVAPMPALEDRPCVLLLLRDTTEHRRLESELQQAQKMEAVGRLAGGIAHDFNNILTAILSSCDLITMDMPPGDPLHPDVEEIRNGALRAAALTRQLLAFSRRQVLQPERLNLNEIVQTVEPMLRRVIGEDIEIASELSEGLPMVAADRGQLEQVILNLVVNSRDALPSGGRITLRTGCAALPDELSLGHPATQPWAVLSVSDDGNGMDDATREHIFEPFFTTKGKDKGTGLGLSTVYGIIKQSGGEIRCLSAAGAGTTMEIYLPASQAQPDATGASPAPAHEPERRGTETVLLVEDDDMVRVLVRRVLSSKGYTVIEARDSDEALAAFTAQDGAIRLLVTDVIMPGLSGPDLAKRLTARKPGLKVLLLSGYTEERVNPDQLTRQGAAFLAKPFSPETLVDMVRNLLDS